jgi:hypothetical protein
VASGPKELVIVPKADHVDLYDKLDVIPFDKLTSFFTEHLNDEKGSKTAKTNGFAATQSSLATK